MDTYFAKIATATFLALSGTVAHGATLDFIAEADGAERGVADGTVITMDGVDVTFSSNYFAYFDSGNAGLGVCQDVTDFSVSTGANRCASGAGDDNVTIGESVTLSFGTAMNLSNLIFTEEGHHPFGETTGSLLKTLLFALNDDGFSRYTFGQLSSASFTDVKSFTLAYDNASFSVFDDRGLDRNNEQFYLASATVNPVPIPAGLPLMLAGLGALGFVARRKQKAA